MHTLWAPPLLPGLASITSKSGVTYGEFRKTLNVNFFRIQVGIVCSFLSLFVILFLCNKTDNFFLLIFMSVSLALTQHRILNVVHEGAHYLLSRSRKFNDTFCNFLAGWFILCDVDQYRITHIEHHRNLGSEFDPENAHMEKLDLTWLVSLISGFNTVRRISVRKQIRSNLGSRATGKPRHLVVPFLGLLLHSLILLFVYNILSFQTLVVWLFSTFFLTPALGILRNLLEHKYVESVDSAIWYQILGREKPADAVLKVTTRTFTKSLLSRLYGSMGFTRHLLHHWDPSISFSNLGKVHKFLLETPLEANLRKVDSTFSSTFVHLWRK
jgi:fatty acid desaturase